MLAPLTFAGVGLEAMVTVANHSLHVEEKSDSLGLQ